MSPQQSVRLPALDGFVLAGIGAAVVLGFLLAVAPSVPVFAWCSVALLASIAVHLWVRQAGLELWHALVVIAMSGYIVLNYGFTNLALSAAGMPLVVGHGLMFTALALVLLRGGKDLVRAIREPAVLSLAALLLLSALHLIWDVPRFGLYAFRDTSVFSEGVFMILGLIWGFQVHRTKLLLRYLLMIFLANFLYGLTSPWAHAISAHSPVSGVFLRVPLFGVYAGNSVHLLAGAFFCAGPARYAVRWPRPVLLALAIGQLFGLLIYQHRALYVALVAGLLITAFAGKLADAAKLVSTSVLALLVMLVLTSVLGIELHGRVGPINLDFLENHLESLLLKPGTPAVGTLYDREKWYSHVWNRIQSSTRTLIVGEGFGEPLINFKVAHGVSVRQPHNIFLSVLARVGLVGFVLWIIFNGCMVWRFTQAYQLRKGLPGPVFDLAVWLFVVFAISMIVTSVQPYLEFTYGAVPFYVLMGVALGMIRNELDSLAASAYARPHFP